jgi:hypothetical protein
MKHSTIAITAVGRQVERLECNDLSSGRPEYLESNYTSGGGGHSHERPFRTRSSTCVEIVRAGLN